jgi:hypothetical protein
MNSEVDKAFKYMGESSMFPSSKTMINPHKYMDQIYQAISILQSCYYMNCVYMLHKYHSETNR